VAAHTRKFERGEGRGIYYFDTSDWVEHPKLATDESGSPHTSIRLAVLDFLDTLQPSDVYSVCEAIQVSGDKEIVVYYRK
jgi:hypothetical protein